MQYTCTTFSCTDCIVLVKQCSVFHTALEDSTLRGSVHLARANIDSLGCDKLLFTLGHVLFATCHRIHSALIFVGWIYVITVADETTILYYCTLLNIVKGIVTLVELTVNSNYLIIFSACVGNVIVFITPGTVITNELVVIKFSSCQLIFFQ